MKHGIAVIVPVTKKRSDMAIRNPDLIGSHWQSSQTIETTKHTITSGESPAVSGQYLFEESKRGSSKRTVDDAIKSANTFFERVNQTVTYEKFGEEDKNRLVRFFITTVSNISWYEDRLKKQRQQYRITSWLTIIMLIVLPMIIFVASLFPVAQIGGVKLTSDSPSILIAVLSGLLAAYGAWREWADKRLRLGETWKASADLKEKLYVLETKFPRKDILQTASDQSSTLQLSKSFREILDETETACAAIVKAETQSFFQSMTLPKADIASALSAARQSVAGLMTGFGAKINDSDVQVQLLLQSKVKAVAQAKAALGELERHRTRCSTQLVEIETKIASPEKEEKGELDKRKADLKGERDKIDKEMIQANDSLRQAEVELAKILA